MIERDGGGGRGAGCSDLSPKLNSDWCKAGKTQKKAGRTPCGNGGVGSRKKYGDYIPDCDSDPDSPLPIINPNIHTSIMREALIFEMTYQKKKNLRLFGVLASLGPAALPPPSK